MKNNSAAVSVCVCLCWESERYQSSSTKTCSDTLCILRLRSHFVSHRNVLSSACYKKLPSVSVCGLLCVLSRAIK